MGFSSCLSGILASLGLTPCHGNLLQVLQLIPDLCVCGTPKGLPTLDMLECQLLYLVMFYD